MSETVIHIPDDIELGAHPTSIQDIIQNAGGNETNYDDDDNDDEENKKSWDGNSNPSDSSNNSIDDDGDVEDESETINVAVLSNALANNIEYRKLSFASVKKQVNLHYEQDTVHKYSSALDILASYLKGQKIIYMEARTYTVRQLNLLMLPCIFLSSACSVL